MRRLRLQRHRLRARRVARLATRWSLGELDAILAPERERRRWLELATTYEALGGTGLAPWQRDMLAIAADARRLGQDIVVGVPRQW
ncbi:hypothetical protein I5G63_gp095 [Mycobacterium phage Imvubu]|uniref:Uncharacterized protein n=1 Tax=Mycobacterium phage Imvubu TaxID=2686233 RepID=A0A6B9LFY1_9CAUD|nr:hypothetical protein I5G63_gp095 [Mycobacterium phage Imvubu]QHB37835.1 hypothetical protein PBI_IMVUBU_95 [Mycobacterium phage Imvubu]